MMVRTGIECFRVTLIAALILVASAVFQTEAQIEPPRLPPTPKAKPSRDIITLPAPEGVDPSAPIKILSPEEAAQFNIGRLEGEIVSLPAARQIAQRVFPSVVLLIMEDRNGQAISQGSGFVVQPGVVVTNFHVVEGAAAGVAKVVGGRKLHDVTGAVAVDEGRDLILLAIPSIRAPPLPLGDPNKVLVGDPVYAVGNPLGLEGTFSEGIISGIRHVEADTIFQITAPVSPGSSGGPILDARGRVIGVATALIEGGQNLNFAVPSSHLVALLALETTVKPLAKVTRPRVRKSAVAGLGTKSVEGVKVTHFKWRDHCCTGWFSYSIRNRLRKRVKSVKVLTIFFDGFGEPIDVHESQLRDVVRPNLAIRGEGVVGSAVREIVEDRAAPGRIEFRVLDFTIVE